MPADRPSPPRPPGGPRPGGLVLVLAGGDPPHPDLVVPAHDLVVAADSGAHQAGRLGVAVDVLVGDLDSIDPAVRAHLEASGTRVEAHHPDKDATDIELALQVALHAAPAAVTVVGGHGGRLDHALATVAALAAIAAPGLRVEAWMGGARVQLAVDAVEVAGRVGELVSLLPQGGPATGVTTAGLRWPLAGATLAPGSTWAMSNEVAASPASVSLTGGVLAVVRPHALDPAADRRHPAVPDRPADVPPAPGAGA